VRPSLLLSRITISSDRAIRRYDFDLKTGKSELTSLRTCTYAVEVKDDGSVYVECPDGGTNWRLVELRPVSEGDFVPHISSPLC